MFRIDAQNRQTQRIEEVEFSRLGFRERQDIQEWVAANPEILGEDLLIIGKEFNSFDRTGERPDLLAVDRDGKLVVIELKRDDSGTDAHWQAIKYASYFQKTTPDEVVGLAAQYLEKSPGDTHVLLLEHMGVDDLNDLNHDQRIILASHRFAPEVTSAALWLNGKEPGLISCVQLTPFLDPDNAALYVQATTIIPVPGVDSYLVNIVQGSHRESTSGNSFATKLAASYARNKNDVVSQFAKKVGSLVADGLPDELRPDKQGRWAGAGTDCRYYRMWYSRPPWGNWKVHYAVELRETADPERWSARIQFENLQSIPLTNLGSIKPDLPVEIAPDGAHVRTEAGPDTLNDDYGARIAEIMRELITQITPIVDDYDNEAGEEDEE